MLDFGDTYRRLLQADPSHGPVALYDVTRLTTNDQPAELRFVAFGCPVRGDD